MTRVSVVGAGVAGLTCALELAERGAQVEVLERGDRLGEDSCSWYAGGMLAPWCELEAAEQVIGVLGQEALDYWVRQAPGLVRKGSLVLAAGRDLPDLDRFERRTSGFTRVGAEEIDALEPGLAGRFQRGLLFPQEAHLDPRTALRALTERLAELGVPVRFGVDGSAEPAGPDVVVDCRGLAARDDLPDLRGVRGEMLLVRTREVTLERTVRLLHPRQPAYIVPRGEGLFLIGATMVENDERRVTARAVLELLGAAYALHPAFAEAEVVEVGAHVRPAFPDNLPRVRRRGDTVHVNGLYRHGFLLAPALARRVAGVVLDGAHYPEVME